MKLLSIFVLSLFFSQSVFCSDSDLIEDVIVPIAPQPKIKRDFSLKSLENFVVTNGDGQETMAIAVYPLRKNDSYRGYHYFNRPIATRTEREICTSRLKNFPSR